MLQEVKKKKLTTKLSMDSIEPVDDLLLVTIKSWPAQTSSGLIVPDSYTVIKGEKYITEVHSVGENVKMVKPGDVVIVSMYSGHHIATSTGFGKLIRETDIIAHKKEQNMILAPETFLPGMNYVLVKIEKEKELVTDAGIVVPASFAGNDKSKQDVATVVAEVISVGPTNEYGKKFDQVKPGTKIVLDSYVGLDIPNMEVTDESIYRVVFSNDILGIIKSK